MKRNTILLNIAFLFALILIFSACQKDPFADVENNERSIEEVSIGEGQIGPAAIIRGNGGDTVLINVKAGTIDLSKVTPRIMASIGASVSPASGETVDFLNADSALTYTVTAESGKTRTWVMKIKEFVFDLDGTWKVEQVRFDHWIGDGESWGWGNHDDNLVNYFPELNKNLDNTLKFNLEGAEGSSVYGTYTFESGADGNSLEDFIHTGTNFNYKFKKLLPSGTWSLDIPGKKMIFNAGTPNEGQTFEIAFSNNKNTLKLPFNPGAKDIAWDNEWGRMDVQGSGSFWYVLQKQ
ncbi:hypothetical protein [Rubrolithibacter danxiaensis]|uniref:hypothetical protein n=1 Tax=Rubrolithibacter danxiaensis TaxID=3390805 RepID=UPI003BF7B2EE